MISAEEKGRDQKDQCCLTFDREYQGYFNMCFFGIVRSVKLILSSGRIPRWIPNYQKAETIIMNSMRAGYTYFNAYAPARNTGQWS